MNKKQKRILCLQDNDALYPEIKETLSKEDYFVYDYSDIEVAFSQIYNEPPDIIILFNALPLWKEFMLRIKNDSVYRHLPLILLTTAKLFPTLIKEKNLQCDDFLIAPILAKEILLRLQIRTSHAILHLDANPLTRLPGNYTIMAMIEKTLKEKEKYSLAYVDLDNFKAFNDRYGFTRGDEAIRMTARILTNVVHRIATGDNFVGHVGGDDFFFIIPSKKTIECCEQIIQNFDMVIPTLINDEDRVRGYIESIDRKGVPQKFPLLSLSIAAIDLALTKINHPGEVASLAGQLKKKVKKLNGSNYLIDRRSN